MALPDVQLEVFFHNIFFSDALALSMMTLWRGAVVGSDGGGCVMETSSSLFLAVNS